LLTAIISSGVYWPLCEAKHTRACNDQFTNTRNCVTIPIYITML